MITDIAPTISPRTSGETLSDDEVHTLSFDRAFVESGMNRASVLSAFTEIVESLPKKEGRERQLRDIAKAAALSTARSYGNIIETGRVLLGCIDEFGRAQNLNVRDCKDQLLLGLAEGACQIGPIVYGRFLDVASDYRDNADDWIAKNKKREIILADINLPVIVPFEAELTLSSQTFHGGAPARNRAETPPPNAPKQEMEIDPVILESTQPEADPSDAPKPEATPNWSRPKGKGFFARLSDVVGNLLGRNR